jgi:hypothetical protein
VATLSPDKPRGARLARAALWARDGERHPQGLSQRQAAKVLAVPRSMLPAWRLSQDSRAACPAVAAFCPTVPGLAGLPRLVLAGPVGCVALGACGMRRVCLWLPMPGLNRCGGASEGTPPPGAGEAPAREHGHAGCDLSRH